MAASLHTLKVRNITILGRYLEKHGLNGISFALDIKDEYPGVIQQAVTNMPEKPEDIENWMMHHFDKFSGDY